MLQKQLFLPYFKQRGFVFKYKLIAVHQRYEAAAISIRKGLFKYTLDKFRIPIIRRLLKNTKLQRLAKYFQ